MVDHPGTPVQVIGGIVIKLYYLLTGQKPDIVEDVLNRPEEYLFYINLVLIIIVSIALFILGKTIYKYTQSIWIALLIQLSPFVSYTISYEFAVVNPEHFLIAVIIIFIAVLFKYLYCNDSLKERKLYFAIIFSVVCGLGIATKITFTPLIVIPFILLKGIKQKSLLLFFTLIFFLVFVSPVIYNYEYFWEWIKKLFIYDGTYGKGNPDIVDPFAFGMHLKEIFINENLFALVYLFIFLTILFPVFKYYKRFENLKSLTEYKFLTGIFVSMTLQLIIVAKHYSGHYMVPALMMVIPGLFLSVNILINNFYRSNKLLNLNNIYTFLILMFCIFISVSSWINIKDSIRDRDEALKLNNFIINNYENPVLISSYGSSSSEYAIAYSTIWAGNQKSEYQKILYKLYPDKLFFEYWKNKLYSLTGSKDVKNILHSGRKIIFQNKYKDSNEKLIDNLKEAFQYRNPEIKEVFTNLNGESVYELQPE